MSSPIVQNFIRVNGIVLNVAEAGEEQAPVILFLHGFPEFWYAWHQHLPFFAQKGFRAIAPDQRGYNLSTKPRGVKAYKIQNIIADTVALIKSLTSEKIILVGHDWGGAVAWALARQYPQLLQKLIILNMAHPEIMHAHLRRNPRQMLRSWYAGFFQLPLLPEWLSSAFGYKLLTQTLIHTARLNTFSAADLQHYQTAWEQPGALTGMLNWYRAYSFNPITYSAPIDIPTLLIWGNKDSFLGPELAAPSINLCRNGSLIYLPEATHWLHHEQPQEVNNLIFDFIKK